MHWRSSAISACSFLSEVTLILIGERKTSAEASMTSVGLVGSQIDFMRQTTGGVLSSEVGVTIISVEDQLPSASILISSTREIFTTKDLVTNSSSQTIAVVNFLKRI